MKPNPAFTPTTQDTAILKAVYHHRFLTRDLLLDLVPPDPAQTPAHCVTDAPHRVGTNLDRRLAKLAELHYLDRFRQHGKAEFVYALAERGAEWLASQQLTLPFLDADWREKNRTLGRTNESWKQIDHTLMVSRFAVALTCAVRAAPHVQLTQYQREARPQGQEALKVTWTSGSQRLFVNPDAVFRVSGYPDRLWCLEADRSTMSLSRMGEKFTAYTELYQREEIHQERFRADTFRVAVVTRSPERASSLLHYLRSESDVPERNLQLFFFTTEAAYRQHPENVLAAIWRNAGHADQKTSLIPQPLARRGGDPDAPPAKR